MRGDDYLAVRPVFQRPRSGSGRRWGAFTLIELLVVMAIVSLLVSLLFPAVQTLREAARKTSCRNNLKQIGLALITFESAKRSFPIGCVECRAPVSPPRFSSWIGRILPHLEQQAVFDRLDFSKPMWHPDNELAGSEVLPTMLCPSSQDETVRSTSNLWRGRAFTDYGGLYGVEGEGHDADDPRSLQVLARQFLGSLVYEVPVEVRDISDGLSHTAIVAEMRSQRVSGECEWVNGHQLFAQENGTPVNSDSALGNGIGSLHPGGALVAYCDGHVGWLTDSIGQNLLNAAITRAGREVEKFE